MSTPIQAAAPSREQLLHCLCEAAIEVLSGTGRMVCRVAQARLCRCGGSRTKPFCDGSHAGNGFHAD